ncbi:MAG: alanine--tRNA ligase-related protein [bacterium]
MKTRDIRKKYLEFYKSNGHIIIPSAPLVPENDPTTLFTGSGMQPLVPFLLGAVHPAGNRLTDSQKSFRSADIEDVGDNRHTTFFEMLGNWSLGSYFKTEQIPWIFTFLTDIVGLDPKKIYVTVFAGDEKNNIPRDMEAVEIWKENFSKKGIVAKDVEIITEERGSEVGIQDGRIFYYNAGKNWWTRSGSIDEMPCGEPGGPDSEMFYEFDSVPHDKKFGKECHPNCDCGRFIEIGNSVFMEYRKGEDGTFSKLPQKNVDFGGGLERITMASENTPDIFAIDVFAEMISKLEKMSGKSYSDTKYTASFRVIADHIRASTFLIGDGVFPGNIDQGYFVRRLIRRAVRYFDILEIKDTGISSFVLPLLEYYKEAYPATYEKRNEIESAIRAEEQKFRGALSKGYAEFEKLYKTDGEINGTSLFSLFTSHGFPMELSLEIAKEKAYKVSAEAVKNFKSKMEDHKNASRAGSEQKFKGGLADKSDIVVKYHTATHLLHKALHDVLGDGVAQKGSNITSERLRFDFSHGAKMTDEEKKKVEDIVNEKIKEALPVQQIMMSKAEAEKTGAFHFFGDKYGDQISVYFVGKDIATAFSKEFCGGPHVKNTSELGKFKIIKEEAVSAGVRRIKAILE